MIGGWSILFRRYLVSFRPPSVVNYSPAVTKWDGEDFAEFETASGELALFMYSRKAFVQAINEGYVPSKGINQTFEIAFWLPSYADVDAEYERLLKLDVPFPTGEPTTFSFGIRNFYVTDPEGNLLEIGSTSEK